MLPRLVVALLIASWSPNWIASDSSLRAAASSWRKRLVWLRKSVATDLA